MICAVSILSKMAAERQTVFKISYHMVNITSQVQKIRSGCILLNIARRVNILQHRGATKT